MLDPVLSRIDADMPHAIQRLLALLRIPSISTDRAYAKDCEVAADWLVQDLRDMGFHAQTHPTPGRPWSWARAARAAATSSSTATTTCSPSTP
jgi:acetylornithine deacetylase/succinyl-diaminopimelate desuccinylase-like protein